MISLFLSQRIRRKVRYSLVIGFTELYLELKRKRAIGKREEREICNYEVCVISPHYAFIIVIG